MPGHDDTTWDIDGREVDLSNLDRVLWPRSGLTKADLIHYYRDIAPVIVPYLTARPLTLRVFPDGVDRPGFYLRDLPAGAPDWLRCAPYQPETRPGERCVPLIDGAAGLVWYADRGGIEVHLWPCTVAALDRPDWVVFDLDPGPDVGFERVLDAATLVRDELDRLGVTGLPKTSGGRGLHVFVPVEPNVPFASARDWVKAIAARLSELQPDLIGTAGGRTHRQGLVTIDHAQNSLGRNTAAPYTPRATPDATVSAPLSWDEVETGTLRPGDFTLLTLPRRLRDVGDPWRAALDAPRHRLPTDRVTPA